MKINDWVYSDIFGKGVVSLETNVSGSSLKLYKVDFRKCFHFYGSDGNCIDVTGDFVMPILDLTMPTTGERNDACPTSLDQPEPSGNTNPAIWDLVINDIKERDAVGEKRYGTRLQPFNGRDPKIDLYQELLDAVAYCRQDMEERKHYPFKPNFEEAIRTMQHAVHKNAQDHGWWDDPREDGTVISLIHSELSELVEALRVGNPEDKHCKGFTNGEIEAADAVIRIMDFCERKGWNLGKAIVAKHEVNKGREYKHGNKEF